MRTMMLLSMCLACLGAPPASAYPVRTTVAEAMSGAVAVIEEVEAEARTVTLRGTTGSSVTVTVHPRVANLREVRAGDQVLIQDIDATLDREAGTRQDLPTLVLRSVELRGRVERIDRANRRLTLRDVQGEARVFTAGRELDKLAEVRPDSPVVVHFMELIEIRPPGP
jgi:hypothetical protein